MRTLKILGRPLFKKDVLLILSLATFRLMEQNSIKQHAIEWCPSNSTFAILESARTSQLRRTGQIEAHGTEQHRPATTREFVQQWSQAENRGAESSRVDFRPPAEWLTLKFAWARVNIKPAQDYRHPITRRIEQALGISRSGVSGPPKVLGEVRRSPPRTLPGVSLFL